MTDANKAALEHCTKLALHLRSLDSGSADAAAIETLISLATPAANTGECCVPDEGEPSFVLLGRDPQAPALVERWAEEREASIPDSPKPAMARKIAADMREFKKQHPGRGMPATMYKHTIAPRQVDDTSIIDFALAELYEMACSKSNIDGEKANRYWKTISEYIHRLNQRGLIGNAHAARTGSEGDSVEALEHDLERQVKLNNELVNEIEALRAAQDGWLNCADHNPPQDGTDILARGIIDGKVSSAAVVYYEQFENRGWLCARTHKPIKYELVYWQHITAAPKPEEGV